MYCAFWDGHLVIFEATPGETGPSGLQADLSGPAPKSKIGQMAAISTASAQCSVVMVERGSLSSFGTLALRPANGAMFAAPRPASGPDLAAFSTKA